MDKLTPFAGKGNITMSSREIAELVESRHDSVRRTIERLMEKEIIQLTPAVEVKNHLGQMVSEYRLEKRDSFVVVAQLSPEFTARLVDRWQELEGFVSKPAELSKTDLAHMIIESEAEKAALQIENQNQAIVINNMEPKAQAHDRFINLKGKVNLRQSMREINARPNLGVKHLRNKGVLFPEGKNPTTPKAEYVQRGYFTVKPSKPNREGETFPQTFVTPKGVAWLDKVIPGELRIGGDA